jgi:hypothetical protein
MSEHEREVCALAWTLVGLNQDGTGGKPLLARSVRLGCGWIGLDWIGLDWIGLDWIGLDWIGLDWIGLGWVVVGLDWL